MDTLVVDPLLINYVEAVIASQSQGLWSNCNCKWARKFNGCLDRKVECVNGGQETGVRQALSFFLSSNFSANQSSASTLTKQIALTDQFCRVAVCST